MAKRNYSFQGDEKEKKIARARASNQPISFKYSAEICREIRGKNVDKAVAFLGRVKEKKDFLPLKRYVGKVAHRKGDSKSGTKTGRFPLKASETFMKLLEAVKSNADYKGLDEKSLKIIHAQANQGFRKQGHQAQGRISGKPRHKKSTHIEVIVKED
ncbi:MAG: 50S ribosomal protein L22 [archaeon]